jgi:hypothetical protein
LKFINFLLCQRLPSILLLPPAGGLWPLAARSKKLYMWECEVWEEIPYGVSILVALEELAFDGSESLKMNLEGLRKSSKED